MRKKNKIKVANVKLSSYQSFSYKYFRKFGANYVNKHPELGENMEKGRILVLPEAYAATVYMTTAILFFSFLTFGYLFIFAFYPDLTKDKSGFMYRSLIPYLFYAGPFLFPAIGYYMMMISNPRSAVNKRAKNIDVQLPYAVNFLAAMASTNSTPEKIFRSLSTQKHIYGEICDDANWIYRDTRILGIDIIKTFKNGIKRSPSKKLAEFLQGIINALTSGRPLQGYLHEVANKFMQENRREQDKFIETLAFLAESYVVVGVAFPIFFMVILVIMYWVSGAGMSVTDEMLYAVVFGGLPIINGMYIFIVYLVTPEV